MAGEEGSSKARTTRSKTKRAAKAAVSGGEGYVLTRCHHAPTEKSALTSCTTKRKAEESVCTTKRKAAGIGCSELKQEAEAKGEEKEEAPAKKKVRLPQEDLDRILSRPRVLKLPPYVRDLVSRNPGLIPSAEEEMDEETMELYEEARLLSDSVEAYREFQAWVRSDYDKYGYVEVVGLKHQNVSL